ncbi:MAG: histidine phosphatase family protein [Alphaproteobacteria bacterium]|nr:histidine phosphatase family protein [Alphaproteobacteria bacterium]
MLLIRHGQSEFNAVFNKTRVDPGIRDPKLTDEGKRQAEAAARALRNRAPRRLVSSPYTRALETAHIIADVLGGLAITVDRRVGERAAFVCDFGTPLSGLRQAWPKLALDHLRDEEWWPRMEESEEGLAERARDFHDEWDPHPERPEIGVITHWGFIRASTGLTVPNCTIVRMAARGAAEIVHPREP